MAVRFVIGRAGSGKSELCLRDIKQRLLADPDGPPLILLVPEQATFQAEHALVSSPGVGGMIRAQVLSFHRLAWRLMQEEGGTARLAIDETGKKLLLFRILQERKDDLRLFRHAAEQTGFVDRLNQLFTELKRYCVTAELLAKQESGMAGEFGYGGMVGDKLHDIRLVYADFERELARQYLDGEDYLTLLAQQILASTYLREASVWIDGFHGFTPQELTALERLFAQCAEVTVTLCLNRGYEPGAEPQELDLFHPTAQTMIELQNRLVQLGLPPGEQVQLRPEVAPRFAQSPALAYLERAFEQRVGAIGESFAVQPGQRGLEEQLTIRDAVNRRAEAEGAARDMLRLAREKGVRWRDMAVMVRNMESYGDLLRTVLTDFGIPHFFDEKRTVLHHPLVEFIRSALETVASNWPYDAVFRCVKTDLLLPGAGSEPLLAEQRSAMDQLENYVLACGIKGSRWTDGKPWTYTLRADLDNPEQQQLADAVYTERLNTCRAWVVGPLQALAKRLRQARTVQGKVEALYELLLDIEAPDKLEAWSAAALAAGNPEKAREHGQMWNGIIDMFDQLVETMGEQELSGELFAGLVDTGLESMKLGLVPPSMDQVLIGSMDRTRSSGIRYAYLLGLNEGVVPAQLQENGVLTEAERELLASGGLPMADGSRRKLLDEQFLIYTSLTVPSHRLWLSYPLSDEEGKTLLPSELIKQLRRLFPAVGERLLPAEPAPEQPEEEQLDFIAHPGHTLSRLAVRLKGWMNGEPMPELWWDAYNWFAGQRGGQTGLQPLVKALLYTNREADLSPEASRRLYGRHLRASVSRMEKFAACPFSHFASHGLKLQQRRVYKLDAPDIGQLFHAALNQFARGLQEEQLEWGMLTDEEIFSRSAQVVEELSPRLQGEILLSSSRYAYIARKLKQVVGRAAVVLGEHARRGEFKPLGLELAFGPGQTLPPLTFTLENGCTMEIIGRIDRVDGAEGQTGWLLRVIDYKSSQTSLQLSELMYGLSLQMLTYLDVVLTHAELWLGLPAKPAGVLYFHVHNPLLSPKNALDRGEIERELRKRFKMKGLVTADPDVAGRMDDELARSGGHSQLIPVALKKDGSFYSSSSVATDAQWEQLRSYVRNMVQRIGVGITDGHVAITPFRMGKKTACQFCDYKAVCQFDPLLDDNELITLRPRSKEQIWQELERTQER
ncbi:helicase-exonuclease AddAB subunit AddB [Paenibacillus athensensis]|uniref:ATP-dependent helicase/deoxyribonuclease subunit B n=1 Tax=Paenibacillus athensensis TaxID=1967502 RepID=A0A4Y8PSM5_9BACL|nr:helicase-exonuclease AddAB subunit AddB [Paenibacillus athensensis]MCD1261590.1 helicase-exonuclease AddAB subunit AddB [Paenibacillus athensensis]